MCCWRSVPFIRPFSLPRRVIKITRLAGRKAGGLNPSSMYIACRQRGAETISGSGIFRREIAGAAGEGGGEERGLPCLLISSRIPLFVRERSRQRCGDDEKERSESKLWPPTSKSSTDAVFPSPLVGGGPSQVHGLRRRMSRANPNIQTQPVDRVSNSSPKLPASLLALAIDWTLANARPLLPIAIGYLETLQRDRSTCIGYRGPQDCEQAARQVRSPW